MNWYKRSQYDNDFVFNKIVLAIDNIVLSQLTTQDIVNAFERRGISFDAADTSAQVLPKAAQTAFTTPKTRRKNRHVNSLKDRILRLVEQGKSNRQIGKEIGISTQEVTNILKDVFSTPQDKIEYLRQFGRPRLNLFLDEFNNNPEFTVGLGKISKKLISQISGVPENVLVELLAEKDLTLSDLTLQRKFAVEDIIVNFALSLPSSPPSILELSRLFKKQYPSYTKITDKVIHEAVLYRNISIDKNKETNTLFAAVKYFLQRQTGKGISDITEGDDVPRLIDIFVRRYGEGYGFPDPPSQDMIIQIFMTKIQLRERTQQTADLSQFYNQHLKSNQATQVVNLIEEGMTPDEISRQLNLDPASVNKVYQLYKIRTSPFVTDESHPSYLVQDREGENSMNWYKKAKGLPGGLADKKKPSDFNQKELERGQKVEMEHTKNKELAKDIAMDHLSEHESYYSELSKMEQRLEKKENK